MRESCGRGLSVYRLNACRPSLERQSKYAMGMGKYAHEEPCCGICKTAVDRKYEGITVSDPLRLDAELRGTLPGHSRTPSLLVRKTRPQTGMHGISPQLPQRGPYPPPSSPSEIPGDAAASDPSPGIQHAARKPPPGRIHPPPPTTPSSQAPSRSPGTRPTQLGSSRLLARDPRATRSRYSHRERTGGGTSTRDFPAADHRPGSSTSSGPDTASHPPGSRSRS